jgi:hypothetical protein
VTMIEHVSEQDLLLAFDGELSPDRDAAVRAHTRDCAACEERWASLAHLSQQVVALQCPDVTFVPRETAVAALLSRIDKAATPRKTHWTSRSFAVANTLVAIAAAITCIVLLPSLRVASHNPARASAIYDLEQSVPPGYMSLPFADPALPLDDAEVLPVELSAEDLELMGVDAGVDGRVDANAAAGDGVRAEILIGMDGWPRAIRIVE